MTNCLSDCSGSNSKWICSGGTPSISSSCLPKCQDGFKVGGEICDAGTALGCLPDCSGVETGYTCNGGTTDLCSPICGDGRVITPETCDDGSATHLPPY